MGPLGGPRADRSQETILNGATGIVAFMVTLLVMVLFHEFGHFITARKFGIKVEEFFIGFGPRLISWWRGETEYGVKAILLGGYVRIAGMNPMQVIPPEELPRTFGAKPAWQRAIVLFAGSMTHFILAILLFSTLYWVIGVHDYSRPLTRVEDVTAKVGDAEGPARVAGIKPGDVIVSISGKPIRSWDDLRDQVRPNAGKELIFEVERDGRRLQLPVTPVAAKVPVEANSDKTETVGQVGVAPSFRLIKESPPQALWHGIRTTGESIVLSVVGAGRIFSPEGISAVFQELGGEGERDLTEDQPIGLIGGARLAGQATSAGDMQSLIMFLGIFIVFVGVINLAPLPPLDGGHLLVLAIEKISRRVVDPRRLIPVAGLVLGFLLILTVALFYLDLARPLTDPFQ
jgi:membrane-associated protease RseP (regulator of RpoE activity)